MALLEKRPTYFVKDGDRRAAYYTITARELRAEGYVEEGEKAAPANLDNPLPEVPVVAGGDAFEAEEEEVDVPYQPVPRRSRRKKKDD